MSITLSTAQQISNSQLNTSKSKQLYSFPKSKRFNDLKKPICDQIYEIPSSISKRKAAFGYGTKSDFTKGKNTGPAPGHYEIMNQFDNNLGKRKGWFFGESREKMPGAGIFQKSQINTPG